MPAVKVQMPDGRILTVEAPEGATQEQIFAFVQSQSQQQEQAQQPQQLTPEPTGFDGVNPMTDISLFGVSAQDVVDTGNLAQNIATGIVAKPIAGGAAVKDVLQGEGIQGAETVKEITSQIQTPLSEGGQRIAGKIGEAIKGLEENPGFKGVVDLLKSAQSSFTGMMQDASASAVDPFGVAANKIDPEKFPLSEQAQTASNVGGALGEALPQTGLEVLAFKGSGSLSSTGRKALSVAASKAPRGAQSLLAKASPSAQTLKTAASALYNRIDDIGVVVKPKALQTLSNEVSSTVRRLGFNRRIQPKIQGVLDELSKAKSTPLKVSDVEILRRVAQGAAKSIEPSEQAMGVAVIGKIDDFLSNLSPSQAIGSKAKEVGPLLKDARSLWSRASKSELITKALDDATLQASGLENGIRTQFRQILKSQKKLKGFTAEEVAAMKKVVQGGSFGNTVRALGGFSLTEGQRTNLLRSSLGVAGGTAALGPAGTVVLPTLGAISVRLAEKITTGSAKYADDLVRAGKDGQKIVAAYMKNTPKAQRDIKELTELLIKPGTTTSSIKSKLPIVSDSVAIVETFQPDEIAAILGLVAKETEEAN